MTEKQKQIADGKEAKLLLEHPMLIKAFNDILNDGYNDWLTTRHGTARRKRKSITHKLDYMQVKQVLVTAIENGKILEEEIKKEAKINKPTPNDNKKVRIKGIPVTDVRSAQEALMAQLQSPATEQPEVEEMQTETEDMVSEEAMDSCRIS